LLHTSNFIGVILSSNSQQFTPQKIVYLLMFLMHNYHPRQMRSTSFHVSNCVTSINIIDYANFSLLVDRLCNFSQLNHESNIVSVRGNIRSPHTKHYLWKLNIFILTMRLREYGKSCSRQVIEMTNIFEGEQLE
jgi:hypothetical protein